MNLELYKAFYYTVQYGNISRASEHLFITQPALSKAIRQLEDELKCTLFLRTSRGVKLTQEGEILHQYISQAFNFIQTGENKLKDVRDLLGGEIRIGVSDTLCKHYLLPYLKLFHTLHPAVRIHVVCPTTPGIAEGLKAGAIDFGVINLPYDDSQLQFQSILKVQDCFIAGFQYRHLSLKVQPLMEIARHPLLLLEHSSNSRAYIDRYFRENAVSLAPAFELGNMDLLVQFARHDFGIACVIRNFVETELQEGRLFEVLPEEPIPPRSIGVAWLKSMPLPPAARELTGYLEYTDASGI